MSKFQAVGIGNAVVDVITQCDDAFLGRMGIEKGIMQLVDQTRGEALYAGMENRTQMAGGSVANTIAGIGALGLSTAFIGRVSDDAPGRDYVREMGEVGTHFTNAPVANGDLPTSRSMIFVTPDGERSMNTYLGISTELGPDDVDDSVANGAELLFLEGYLYDKPQGKAAFQAAARACQAGGGRAGISLSDPFCVERHRADFHTLAQELDFVIGNEAEWKSLYETNDLTTALDRAAHECELVVCTRSADEVVIKHGEEALRIDVDEITPVDTTGAGDQFAAGFLFGLATGQSLEVSGRMGCIAAGEVIGHFGARPEQSVLDLFKSEGFL